MTLWQKFCDSHVKFVRNSYEFHIFRIFTHFYSREIRTKFVPNSYKFRTNFVRIYVNFECDRRQMGTSRCHKCYI